jgi:hypothetical protein
VKKPGTCWKPTALFVAVFLAGALALFWISNRHETKAFIGIADPMSGCRLRFNLFSDWQNIGGGIGESGKLMENTSFFPPRPSPVRQWIGSRLFHSDPDKNWCMISVRSLKARGFPLYFRECDICPPEVVQLQGGYPEWGYSSDLGPTPIERVFTQRHFTKDGCPATLTRSSHVTQGRTEYTTSLIVYANHSIIYEMIGMAEGAGRDPMERGMEKIISSFHIEKVAVRTSGQRGEG